VVRARLVGSIARMDHKLRRHSRARALLDQALAQLEARSGSGITVLRLELAIDSWLTGDWRRMAATAEQALAEARASADPLLIGTAAAIFALAMYFDGETDRAAALVDESANSLDPLPDASLAARVEALMCLGHAELGIERFAAASAHLERGIAIARSTGQNSWFAMLTCVLGVTELRRGRLASAERTGEEAFEAAILAEDEPQIWALTLQTWIATAQGQLDRAIALGERAIELESRAESLGFRWTPHCSLGAAVLEAGDPTRAVAEILGHAGGPGLDAIERTLRPRYFELLALAQIAEGDLIAAEVSVHRAERTAAGLRLKGRTAEARRARAAVELARGAPAIAERAAREAARLFEAVERPVDCARAQVILARALAASGERAAAESLLERAHAGFDDCGAVRDRDAAARELRRLGRRVARPGSHRAAGRIGPLTRREREVAELAARGASNREIADELFISPKTVEAHLARTFAKLGIRSRAALATAIEREPARA
jgi:DNA-binding NarL/FixJ family response regulator